MSGDSSGDNCVLHQHQYKWQGVAIAKAWSLSSNERSNGNHIVAVKEAAVVAAITITFVHCYVGITNFIKNWIIG